MRIVHRAAGSVDFRLGSVDLVSQLIHALGFRPGQSMAIYTIALASMARLVIDYGGLIPLGLVAWGFAMMAHFVRVDEAIGATPRK